MRFCLCGRCGKSEFVAWQHAGISGIYNWVGQVAESFEQVARAVLNYHGKGEIETIPFPEHLKSRYQEYTQANLTKLMCRWLSKI